MDRSGGPGGRKKWVSGSGKGVGRRGGGLNLGGPAGNGAAMGDVLQAAAQEDFPAERDALRAALEEGAEGACLPAVF